MLLFVLQWFVRPFFANELKIKIGKNGKVGFVNQEGDEVIKPVYDAAFDFNNGFAEVIRGDKHGMIDTKGNVTLPLKYNSITAWNGDIVKVETNKKFGLVKKEGTVILPNKYSHISNLNVYGRAWISKGGKQTPTNDKKITIVGCKYGIVNKMGEILVQPLYGGLFEFANEWHDNVPPYGLSKYAKTNTRVIGDTLITDCSFLSCGSNPNNCENNGLLDGLGRLLIGTNQCSFLLKPENGMVRYYVWDDNQTKCGYFNLGTNQFFLVVTFPQSINNIKFVTHGDYWGNIAPVYRENAWSFVDKNGKVVLSGYKNMASNAKANALALYKSTDECEVYDFNAKRILGGNTYEAVLLGESTDMFVTKQNGAWGAVNRNGDTLIANKYTAAGSARYGWIPVAEDGKWGYIDFSGNVRVPLEFQKVANISMKSPSCVWVGKDFLWYNFDVANQTVGGDGYDKVVYNLDDGYSLVQPKNMDVKENALTRAMVGLPAKTSYDDKSFVEKRAYLSFGYIVGKDNRRYFSAPVTMQLYERVKQTIKANGNNPLNEIESHRLLLSLTKNLRSYPLDATISKDNWDY